MNVISVATLIELTGGDPQQLACPIDGSSVLSLTEKDQEKARQSHRHSEYCAEGSVVKTDLQN